MASLKDHVIALYKENAYPSFGHFLKFLSEIEGIKLSPKTLKSYLQEAEITHPLSSLNRSIRPIRRKYDVHGIDQLWVCFE